MGSASEPTGDPGFLGRHLLAASGRPGYGLGEFTGGEGTDVNGLDSRRAPQALLVAGAVAAAVFVLAPRNSPLQVAAWFVPLVLASVTLVSRVRRGPPSITGPLALLLTGQLGYVAASLVWYLTPVGFGIRLPFPSPLDLVYFAIYATYAAFLLVVIRRQRRGDSIESRLALTDALILTAALSTVVWAAVIRPNLAAGASLAATATAVAYPGFTLLLFGLVVRIAITSLATPLVPRLLLVLWVGTEVAGDIFYGFQSVNGTFHYGTGLSLLWMASYTFLAALAVHPDVDGLLRPDDPPVAPRPVWDLAGPRGWGWLALLYVAALTPLLVDAGRATRLTLLMGAVTFGLVVYRLAVVAGDQREQRRLAAELERANQAKSDFLATMSHEIRTPLNAIVGMTGLLLDSQLAPEQQEYAETARGAGDNLLAIINDILDFSKIEAGRLDLEHQPFSLAECVESAVDLVASPAAAKGLELAYLVDRECPAAVRGDVTRLRQILVNLLGNAVKFTDRGEVLLRVTPDVGGEGMLRFSVTDTGPGIPSELLGRLFEPFRQVDSSTTRTHGGTGLGLAVSRRLAHAMDGTIEVESEVGVGSTFHVTARLPVTEAPPRPCLEAEEMTGKHLLVVDDNDTNRCIVSYQLQTWRMTVATTGDPAEALSWVQHGQRFDAAILDMHMPGMDGIELARALRREGAADLPMILLSSLGKIDRGAGSELFVAVLSKPVKPSALFDALAAGMATHSGHDTAGNGSGAGDAVVPARHLRVLLAEDNVVNQKVAVRVLERLGFRADVVADGAEAVEAVARARYDVVLMDIQMPVMDGLEAARRIRALPTRGVGPVIVAITASAFAEDRARCLEAGMDDYLSKPVRSEDLARALTRAAATLDALRTARTARPTGEPSGAVGRDGLNPDRPCLDRSLLDGMREALQDDSLVVELGHSFMHDTPQRLETLTAAIRDDDQALVAATAHYVKGSAQMFGATRLADLCGAVEAAPERAAGLQEALVAEFDRAVVELRAHLDELA